eukprot:157045-Lingulodinium_polyedra.AAC.1
MIPGPDRSLTTIPRLYGPPGAPKGDFCKVCVNISATVDTRMNASPWVSSWRSKSSSRASTSSSWGREQAHPSSQRRDVGR